MSAKKRTKEKRERDREKVAALYVRGVSQTQIAQAVGVSQQQVSYDIRVLRGRWRDSSDRSVGDELAKIDAIELEHWKAWEATHDAQHLTGVLACVSRRCKLLGFDAPEKRDVKLNAEGFIEALNLLRATAGDSAIAAVLHEPADGGADEGSSSLRS